MSVIPYFDRYMFWQSALVHVAVSNRHSLKTMTLPVNMNTQPSVCHYAPFDLLASRGTVYKCVFIY